MSSRPKLKPCPFCGGRATLKVAFRYMFAVWCQKCDIGTIWRVRGGRYHAKENRQWAIDNWNRRVNETKNTKKGQSND